VALTTGPNDEEEAAARVSEGCAQRQSYFT